jgi:ankyrin repeat protein
MIMAISADKFSISEILKGLKTLSKANGATQTARANEWLAACKDEPEKLAALQQCLKMFKISFEGAQEEIPTSNPNPPSYYKEYYNDALYQQAYAISALAYTFEKNGIVEEHATKLAVMFDDSEIMLNYLVEFAKGTQSNTPLHNACLFNLPDFQEPGFLDKNSGCKFAIFKKMAKSNMLRKDFKEMLPFAWELQKMVVAENKAKACEPKPDKNQIQKNNELINDSIKQIQTDIATYDDLERRKNTLNVLEEEDYNQFAKKLSHERFNLAELSKGKLLKDLSAVELRAIYEKYKINTSEAYKIFLDNNIPEKFFAQFKALNRQGAGEFIPDVTIDGAALGHPGFYLMKVPVMDEKHAARAACFGKMTDCCQSLSGEAGQSCVIHGLTSPYGGFYVICKGDSKNPRVSDEVIGQSWTWRSQSNAIVFDSIEVAESADKEMVKPFYDHLAKTLVEQHQVPKVACGASSGISKEVGIETIFNNKEEFRDYQGYCDSKQQRLIVDSECPYYFYAKSHENQEKTKAFILKALKNNDTYSSLAQNRLLVKMLNWALLENNTAILSVALELAGDAQKKELQLLVEDLQSFVSTNDHSSEQLSVLADIGIYLEIRDPNNFTPLMAAAENGYADTCLDLIVAWADVNAKNHYDQTSVILAAAKGHSVTCLNLIVNGADVNAKDKDDNNSLIYAAIYGHSETCLDLIEEGAQVDAKNNVGMTPLFFAVDKGLTEVCLKLIEKGADVNAKDKDGTTPLMLAAAKEMSDTFLMLIERQANVNAKNCNGDTPLMLAAKNGHNDNCQSLLANGANLETKNNFGYTPLMLAARMGHSDTCLRLLENGADVNAKDNFGNTPLMLAALNGHSDTCLRLLDKGADVNAKNNSGDTPLMLAVGKSLTEVCLKLIKNGAEVSDEAMKSINSIAVRQGSMTFAYQLRVATYEATKKRDAKNADSKNADTTIKTDIRDPKPRNN